ncbi:MAG: AraC family transcriptional regulator [Pseudomonadota bacterium]
MTVQSFDRSGGTEQTPADPTGLLYEAITARTALQDWTYASHAHSNVHQIFWVTRGGGRVVLDGERRGFSTYTLVFIPAGCVHGFDFTAGTLGHMVSIPTDLSAPLPSGPCVEQMSALQDRQEVTACFNAIRDEYRANNLDREAALTAHASLLTIRIRRMSERHVAHAPQPTAAEDLLRRFSALVEERYKTQAPLKVYADALEISPTHLTRVCQSTAGRSASDVVQERVLLEARRLLARTDQRVNDIASELGYADPAYFTRMFASKTGQPPSAFRKAARAGAIHL